MAQFHISKDPSKQRSVAFVYDPLLVTKIKTSHGHQGKLWENYGDCRVSVVYCCEKIFWEISGNGNR